MSFSKKDDIDEYVQIRTQKCLVDYEKDHGIRCWDIGGGPMCCPKHHVPMTIYGGCRECGKELINGND